MRNFCSSGLDGNWTRRLIKVAFYLREQHRLSGGRLGLGQLHFGQLVAGGYLLVVVGEQQLVDLLRKVNQRFVRVQDLQRASDGVGVRLALQVVIVLSEFLIFDFKFYCYEKLFINKTFKKAERTYSSSSDSETIETIINIKPFTNRLRSEIMKRFVNDKGQTLGFYEKKFHNEMEEIKSTVALFCYATWIL
ncbi:hypothetical protein BpHYR1_018790, partial [Brachionus plicatilis]